MKNTRTRWSPAEISYLKLHYDSAPVCDLLSKVNHSLSSIHTKAHLLGLHRMDGIQRKSNLEILNDGSLQSLYWVGFIMADGHFHKRGSTLRLDVAEFDKGHLEEYRTYINATNTICMTDKSSDKYPINAVNMYHLTNVHSTAVNELRKTFQLCNTKTYDPPNFNQLKLTTSQWIALIIGFIDGDGNIAITRSGKSSLYTRVKINIEVHGSWVSNLNYIKTFLYDIVGKAEKCAPSKINAAGLASMSIASPDVVRFLYNFQAEHNLTTLDRKWSKVLSVKAFGQAILT